LWKLIGACDPQLCSRLCDPRGGDAHVEVLAQRRPDQLLKLFVLKHLPPLLIAKRRLVGGKCAGRCGGAIRLRQLRNRPFVVRPDGAR
jgi:hypothetical protein